MSRRSLLSPQTLTDQIRDRLRARIFSGHLGPGTKLNLRDLADSMGVSVMPVRDALRVLATEGLVEVYPRRGFFVTTLSKDDLSEIFLARMPLEHLAVERAVERMTAQNLQQMRKFAHRMEETREPSTWLKANRAFHFTAYRAAGLPRVVRLVDSLWDLVEPYLRLYVQDQASLRVAENEHRLMIRALEEHDAAAMHGLLDQHLAATQRQAASILPPIPKPALDPNLGER